MKIKTSSLSKKIILLSSVFSWAINAEDSFEKLKNCHLTKEVSSGSICIIKPSMLNKKSLDTNNGNQFLRRFGYGYHVVGVPKNWDKRKVHLHFGGSFGKPYDNNKEKISTPLILEEILQSGSMVIQLAYDNANAVNGKRLCGGSGKKIDNCAGKIREAKLYGKNSPSFPETDYENSVVGRLSDLYKYLHKSQLFNSPNINWSSLTVSGHSQGAGMALMLARDYNLKRVCLFAGGYDRPDQIGTPQFFADWIVKAKFKTPKSSMSGLVHKDDRYYKPFKTLFEYLGLYEGNTVFESSLKNLKNNEGKRVKNGHAAIIQAVKLAKGRKDYCYSK